MEEVYVVIKTVLQVRPCNRRTEWVCAVCKDEESVIEAINENLKREEESFRRWSNDGLATEKDIYNFKEISKSDIFKWLTNTETQFITDDYTYARRFCNDGRRRDEWSFYVQKMPIR